MNGSHSCIQYGDCSDVQTTMEVKALTARTRDWLVSNEAKDMCELIIDQVIGNALSYLSIFDNIIAMVVFTKMGYQDTMNISLSAIAFWDIVKGLSQVFMKSHAIIKLASEPLAITYYSHAVLILGHLNAIAGYSSGVMAAYVSIERCLCVSLPFTVRFLLTRKLVTVVNILISFIVVGSYVVVYSVYRIYWVFSPTYNQTIARNTHSAFQKKNPSVDAYIKVLSLLYPLSCFIVICVCSAITVFFLRRASKFRSSTAAGGANSKSDAKQPQQSSRDRQITKILLTIIAVYIVSYIPRLCYYFVFFTVPEFRPNSGYGNLLWVAAYIMFTFDALNSVVNPIILYFMSSQFRNTLIGLFCRPRQKK